jgi:hypothetical protein
MFQKEGALHEDIIETGATHTTSREKTMSDVGPIFPQNATNAIVAQ